jgi:hypothetical protein
MMGQLIGRKQPHPRRKVKGLDLDGHGCFFPYGHKLI